MPRSPDRRHRSLLGLTSAPPERLQHRWLPFHFPSPAPAQNLRLMPHSRRAPSVPSGADNSGQIRLSERLAHPPPRCESPVQAPSGSPRTADSQARSASSILATRSMKKPQTSGRGLFCCLDRSMHRASSAHRLAPLSAASDLHKPPGEALGHTRELRPLPRWTDASHAPRSLRLALSTRTDSKCPPLRETPLPGAVRTRRSGA